MYICIRIYLFLCSNVQSKDINIYIHIHTQSLQRTLLAGTEASMMSAIQPTTQTVKPSSANLPNDQPGLGAASGARRSPVAGLASSYCVLVCFTGFVWV